MILKEDRMEASQSRSKWAPARRLRLLRQILPTAFFSLGRLSDNAQRMLSQRSWAVVVWSLHHQQRLCHHWTLEKDPGHMSSPHTWFFQSPLPAQSRDACSLLRTLVHVPTRVKVFRRYLCNWSLFYAFSSSFLVGSLWKSELHLFPNSGFSCLSKHLLLSDPQPFPVFFPFPSQGSPFSPMYKWEKRAWSSRHILLHKPQATFFFFTNWALLLY